MAQLVTINVAQLVTIKMAKRGPVSNFTAYIYIHILRTPSKTSRGTSKQQKCFSNVWGLRLNYSKVQNIGCGKPRGWKSRVLTHVQGIENESPLFMESENSTL